MRRHSKSRRLYLWEDLAHAGCHNCLSLLIGQALPYRHRRDGGLTGGQMQAYVSADRPSCVCTCCADPEEQEG